MKFGFDELYVVLKNKQLHFECLFDSESADKKIEELRKNNYEIVEKITLEQFINSSSKKQI